MFDLSQKYALGRPIFKSEYIIYTPPSVNLVNGEINPFFIDILRRDCAISMKDSCLELDFINS